MTKFVYWLICFFISFSASANNEMLDSKSQTNEVIHTIEKEIIPLPSCNNETLIQKTKDFVIAYYNENILQNIFDRRRKHFVIDNIDKFCLVMGNEGNGVRKEIQDMCDKNLYIKTNSKVESLNVGVACSILLYELGR